MSAQSLDARLAHIEGAFAEFGERLNSIDRRLDAFEHTVESRFALIDQRLTWIVGILVGTWITTILTVLFHR